MSDDIAPEDVISEEFLLKLYEQNELLSDLIERQKEIIEFQREFVGAPSADDEPEESVPDTASESVSEPASDWGYY